MELLDVIYTANHIHLYSGDLYDFAVLETVHLLEISVSHLLNQDYLHDLVSHSLDLLIISLYVPREEYGSSRRVPGASAILEGLAAYAGDTQGTEEWHKFRGEHLTASSIWKCLTGDASFNSLVRAKCEPRDMSKIMSVSLDSTLHWGHKYEPLSIMLYEHDHDTSVGEFGCIPCSKNSFIAASPDGINIDPSSPKYGRMLEVKNIVNREITGIPKPEYWVQMQVQMAVCNLPICDFLETRFVELSGIEAFLEDAQTSRVGFMSLFMNQSGRPYYEYGPIGAKSLCEYEAWNAMAMQKNADKEWLKNIFWKLDEMLITEVSFNAQWYELAVPKFKECWDAICEVRRGDRVVVPARKRKQRSPQGDDDDAPKKFLCLV